MIRNGNEWDDACRYAGAWVSECDRCHAEAAVVHDGDPGEWVICRPCAVKRAKNAARRECHAAMTDLGLTRVRGNLGGVYYE